ncbi:SusD/RagB family nutrient-binding outer membrane lipoprotein [Thalassobellus citreus]|uniref:SusD/RagB family nutrient-binding outer membrane lipoprotein n=1 Tax=Thalassobellus citreus TaxID=3367752 RepID=UPI00378F019B
MKKIILIIFLFFSLVLINSCQKESLAELNIDPNNPSTVNIALSFTAAEDYILYRYGRFTNASDWDCWAGLFVQTFAGNHGSGINFDQYDVRNNDAFWARWYDGLLDFQDVITRGAELEAWDHVGASKVISALALGSLTSWYGDIPWSEALKGSEIPLPKYDTQEEIYQAIFTLLDGAIGDFNKTSLVTMGSEDIAYNGDIDKWKALAYALKARYENHFSVKDPSGSATRALAAVQQAKTLGFTSFEYDLKFTYDNTGEYQNGWYDMYENNQMIASESFMNLLLNTNDPRRLAYWNDIEVSGSVVGFNGKQSGFGTSNISYSPIGPKGFYGSATSPQLIMTHFELLFIEAEAEFRLNGATTVAATALNNAIKAQLDLVEPNDSDYLEEYLVLKPDYIANFASETSATVTLEKIMTEKYKAMVTMNGEAWVDARRHDYQYPSYLDIPVTQQENPVANQFIQRVLYPQEEISTNSNTPTTVTIFDKLWIFKP